MIDNYSLYGEPYQEVDLNFLHLETIMARSAPVLGNIKPHYHKDLNHIFIVSEGGGQISIDGEKSTFQAGNIFLIPSTRVHSFAFDNGSDGYVLTIANEYLLSIGQFIKGLDIFDNFSILNTNNENRQYNQILSHIKNIEHGFETPSIAKNINITGNLISIIAIISELRKISNANESYIKQDIISRFRVAIDNNFRENLGLQDYLKIIRASEMQLRYACRQTREKSPMQWVLNRRILEAKRLLIYSDLSIQQIGFTSGFDDPAYFSRMFKKETTHSPMQYREEMRR
jgi:AraC family transcriptional activator of pobA